ncbi:acyltransferase family protein [Mesorhizobium huakuii]|nr:acyltransferase [Mesorhizobium huakuii]
MSDRRPNLAGSSGAVAAMIWSLQILRFVAALLVVYVHSAEIAAVATGSNGLLPQDVQLVGRAGVDIFFVISGVIITRIAAGLSWRGFAWRRWRRIVPIYFLVCIPTLLIAAKTGFGWRSVVATFLFWPATDVMTEPLLPVAWTLCFEMLFYAAATLVLWNRRSIYVLIGLYGAAMLLRPLGPVFQFLGNPIILEFLMGVAIANAPMRWVGLLGIPLGAVALVMAGPLGIAPGGGTLDFLIGTDGFRRVLVYGLPAALIVYGTMQIKAKPGIWTEQGDASYSLYLTHTLIASAMLPLWMAYPIEPDLIILVTTAACVLFGWRIHIRFEKPLLAMFNRFVVTDPVVTARS